MNHINKFFERLWTHYIASTPQALKIRSLFTDHGEVIVNDHVAFRTFNRCSFDLDCFTQVFQRYGYNVIDDYQFPEKHLYARAFKHDDPTMPKVFVSELLREKLSSDHQAIIEKTIKHTSIDQFELDSLVAGRIWPLITYNEYLALAEESEYAAWLLMMGLTANHFTISVNHLQKLTTLEKVNQFLINHGFTLNSVGGLIKGGPSVHLAQSSTIADRRKELFSCGTQAKIPTCFYEFALRYKLPSGELFQGFVTNNASRIFDSTKR